MKQLINYNRHGFKAKYIIFLLCLCNLLKLLSLKPLWLYNGRTYGLNLLRNNSSLQFPKKVVVGGVNDVIRLIEFSQTRKCIIHEKAVIMARWSN